MEQLTGQIQEGLLSLAVATGLQVMGQLMEGDVTAVAGAKGKRNPDRTAVRHGTGAESVTLGRRRVPVERPAGPGCRRLRRAAGAGL